LANYLLQSPAQPQAAEILSNCTLHFIPMLNPDGAEAVKRYNAQGIDINRDARRLSTPEGRALLKAVETIKPGFAFNLHNQHARTSVGRPPKPAAVSVLAPAPDPSNKETPGMRRAKLMCATFVEAVRGDIPGMISRYDDTHEPRAFGDTIQATGAATMLVEAGGWTDADIEPLTRVHFEGMLTTLHAIATDKYLDADIDVYEQLPESNSSRQLDWRISNAKVVNALPPSAFTADLGIEQTDTARLGGRSRSDGKIIEIGDLSTLSAKSNTDAAGWLILPGRIAFAADWSPATKAPPKLEALLAGGVTTLVGVVDLANRDEVEAIGANRELPVNWAFVGRLDKTSSLPRAEVVERVAAAANQGLLAITTERANEELWQQLERLGLPLVQLSLLDVSATSPLSYEALAEQAAKLSKLLNLQATRGSVVRDMAADLAMFDLDGKFAEHDPVAWNRLGRVVVAGEAVWEDGKRTSISPGIFIRRT
jgi:hypothetical protein